MAPTDFTGYWVAVITEDWRFRMVTPPKGDFASVPLNDAGQKLANAWDPAKDIAAGEQCRAFGAAGLMRMPIRLHVSWQDDTDAEDRNRQRPAGAPVQVRHAAGADDATRLAGPLRRAVGDVPRRSGPGRRWRWRRRRRTWRRRRRTAVERVAEGRDHADEARLPAAQRHALQRAGGADGVLRPHQRVKRRLVADRDLDGGGSGLPGAAVHDLDALQA